MKQVKTIIKRRDYADKFDGEVNALLKKGWILRSRYIDPGFYGAGASTVFYPAFVAELEREVSNENL